MFVFFHIIIQQNFPVMLNREFGKNDQTVGQIG